MKKGQSENKKELLENVNITVDMKKKTTEELKNKFEELSQEVEQKRQRW